MRLEPTKLIQDRVHPWGLTKEVAVPTTIIMMLILRFKSTEIWVVLSGIVEMLMQSADDAIYLLPGCPIFGRPEL